MSTTREREEAREGRSVAQRLRQVRWTPYLLLMPSTLFLLVFFAWPMFQAVGLGFRADDGGWTLEHVNRMTNDVAFGDAVRNTLIIVVVLIPVQFMLALAMSMLVTAKLKGTAALTYIYALPLVVSDLAAGIVWFSIFTERGYVNSVLVSSGLADQPVNFLGAQTSWPLLIILLAEVWRATSIVFVILVAGLQSIPEEYNEAAAVFGTSAWSRLWRVTLPMLRPSIQVALILRTILAFQVFAVVVALTGGGVRVLALEAFNWYADLCNEQVASVYATLILAISMIITVIYLRVLRTRTDEPGTV